MINQRLKDKLDKITAGTYQPTDFIIADAKDGDMAFGIPAPGPDGSGDGHYKTRADYLNAMTAMARSGLIDILLMSLSSAEVLRKTELWSETRVTPAVRLNDTTDIWSARGSTYRLSPSEPFYTADLEAASKECSLGLYSVTFSNQRDADLKSLEQYRRFRLASRDTGMQHFLEVFNPAFDINLDNASLGDYINDMILKTLAGVSSADAPLFLKMQFNGHRAMADLCSYDPERLVVGILGGAAGTTRDTFELASQAEQAGARVALFGRKINLAEAPLELVRLMRAVIEKQLTCEQAVQSYHEHLSEHHIEPQRPLSTDNQITDDSLKG